jgi:hypothetical protein
MDQRHLQLVWRRSTRCSNGACVEVANAGGYHLVRDSKADGSGPILEFENGVWSTFLAAIRDGVFSR